MLELPWCVVNEDQTLGAIMSFGGLLTASLCFLGDKGPASDGMYWLSMGILFMILGIATFFLAVEERTQTDRSKTLLPASKAPVPVKVQRVLPPKPGE